MPSAFISEHQNSLSFGSSTNNAKPTINTISNTLISESAFTSPIIPTKTDAPSPYEGISLPMASETIVELKNISYI